MNIIGKTLYFNLPGGLLISDHHFFTCWSGTYKHDCLYVAKEWTDNTILKLSDDYLYLYAYDTNLDKTYDFDIYVYYGSASSVEPVYDKTSNYLYWNGLIYQDGGVPNIYLSTNDIYFNDLSLCCTAKSNDFNFFFQNLTLAQELEKIQVLEMWKTLMKNVVISLLAFVVSYLALRKAWSFLRIQLKGS